MRRLTLIGSARLDLVVRPDWDIEFLVEVPIEVAEREHQGPGVVAKPTFENRRHQFATA
jgi:hypothetical protein